MQKIKAVFEGVVMAVAAHILAMGGLISIGIMYRLVGHIIVDVVLLVSG